MTWLEFVILALVAFRLTRLVGWDEITASLRNRASGVADRRYQALAYRVEEIRADGLDPWEYVPPGQEPLRITRRRYYLAKLLHCPWCIGFWISLAVAIAARVWWLDVSWETTGLVAFALSAIVGLTAKNLDP